MPDTTSEAAQLISAYGEQFERHTHEYDSGLLVMPVASRTPAHRVVRTHGGMSLRRVVFNTARSSRPPIIPRAEDTATDKLLFATASPVRPLPNGPAGSLTFAVSGEYLFVASQPRIPGTNSLPTGGFPQPMNTTGENAARLFSGVSLPAHTTVAGYDANVESLRAAAEQVGGRLTYAWPLTVYPAAFSLPTIEG